MGVGASSVLAPLTRGPSLDTPIAFMGGGIQRFGRSYSFEWRAVVLLRSSRLLRNGARFGRRYERAPGLDNLEKV